MKNIVIHSDFRKSYFQIKTQGEIECSVFLSLINLLDYKEFVQLDSLNIILDLRKTQLKITVNEYLSLIAPFAEMVGKFKYVKMAKLVDTPYETALALLFHEDTHNISNLDCNLYNTTSAATRWLFNS
ncbi:MAG: hypothetical protein C0597_07925 [Marinilabiliales bacterium]|nr:MAG: hypothetical protein C0597_07925 [Marinilabiliales bacterium]